MRILNLILRNFKGIRSLELNMRGSNIDVYGDNATGKTTIFDAFFWLLFDKDSSNRKDFQIKTLDSNGHPLHGIDHEVEAIFQINGENITLRKVYSEKWTKKRGSATSIFTGNTTDYFINGVPAKKGEFTARVSEIADENIFKLLTNPSHFNEVLHWQDRRKILLEICGDISDAEVIASDESLSKLPEILEGRKLEDHRKVIASKRKAINDELEKIPVRIDEALRALPDVSGVDTADVTEKVAFLKSRVQEKSQEIIRIKNGGQTSELNKALREVEGRLLDIKNQHRSQVGDKIDAKRGENNEIKRKISSLQHEVAEIQSFIKRTNNSIAFAENEAKKLRDEWYKVNGQEFVFNQDETCPTCGQALPVEQLEEARDKALARFNLTKAQSLEEITAKGKSHSEEVERLKSENDSRQNSIADLQGQIDALEQKSANLIIEIDDMMQSASNITENPDYIQAMKEKEVIEEQIQTLANSTSGLVVTAQTEITSLEAEIRTLESKLVQVDHYKRGQVRIEELKKQEKDLAAEYEKLEQELFLTEEFIRTKVKLLEEKINSRFNLARFKLFDVQINGGINECCETLYNGVPYSSGLNNAARINVGLDIINTLSEHYGFVAPIFVDNAEAVTKLIETRGQVIRLVVSEADKKLRIENQNTMREAV